MMKRRPWTAEDHTRLIKLAGRKRTNAIARQLRRTPGAVRQYATQHNVSLAMR